MKKLTSITVVLMIPTLIASLYGMNVQNKLETHEYGFITIIIISMVFTLLGVIFLRRRNLL